MTYAVIRLGGRQFRVSEGDKIELERQSSPEAEVLLYSDGRKVSVGNPVLKDHAVELVEIAEKRGKKIKVARFKSKSRYRRVKGHRQPLSVFEVKSVGEAKKTKKKSEKKTEEKKAKPTSSEKTKKTTTKKKTVNTKKSETKKTKTKKAKTKKESKKKKE